MSESRKTKTSRIQLRIDDRRKEFLKEYAERRGLTISKIFMDFIDWLQRRDNGDRTTNP